MQKHLYHILLFLLLSLFIAHAQDNETTSTNTQDSNLPAIVTLEKGAEINITMTKGQINFYQFLVAEKITDYDLTLSVDPFDPISDPDIYVSRSNQYPNSTTNSDLSGSSSGYDMITINSQDITQNDTYHFGVKCSSVTCNFTLRLQYTGEYYMSIGYTVRLFYRSTATEVLRLNIPIDLPNDTSHIIIYAYLLNEDYITETFHMYVNQGNDIPTSTNYSLTSKTSWFNGKSVIIYNDSKYFCTNCNYTILLEAQEGTIVDISTLIYSQIMPVQSGEFRYDAVSHKENVTYTLNLTAIQNFDQEDLMIEISPYYGHPELYVDFDKLPDTFQDYRWNSTQTGRKKFIITPQERQDANVSSNSTAYITIYGKTSTTYRISIQNSKIQNNLLNRGESQVGQIDASEIVNYLYSAWDSKVSNVTITLKSSSGKLGIFVKSCENKEDCQFSEIEIENIRNGTTNLSEIYPVTVFSDHTSDINTVKFIHNGTICAPKSFGETLLPFLFSPKLCYYSITLTNQETKKSSYSLLAETDKSLTSLLENTPIRGNVRIKDYSYYVFTISEEDSTIQNISFQVTPLSGGINIFSSKTNQYPNSSEYEKSSSRDFITYDSEDNITFTGNFYVSIEGVDSSSYTITTLIKRNDTTNDTNIIDITEGVPQKFTIQVGNVGYVKFNIDLNNSLYGEIEIMLTAIQGKFGFYVTTSGKLPSNESNDYVSYFGGPLLIDIDNEDFTGTGEFIVAIYPRTYESDNNNDEDFICTVAFVSEYNVFELQPEIPFIDIISNNRTIFFKAEIFPEDTVFEILKVAFNDDFDLFISSEIITPFPNKDNYFKSTINSTSPRIFLSNDNISELCNFSDMTSDKWFQPTCYIAISASTSYKENVWIGVLLKKTSSYVMLRDGMQLEMVYPNASQPLLFYYYPKRSLPLYLILDTIYQDIQLYVSVINSDDFKSRNDWQFPNSTNNSYTIDTFKTQKAVGNELIIPPNAFNSCISSYYLDCILLITIATNENKTFDTNSSSINELFEPTFGLVITSEITPLTAGKPSYSSVDDNSYRYFSLEVTNPNSTLLISLTPFGDGDPDLFVSFGEASRPTFESSQFVSTIYQSDIIQISNEDLGQRKTMEGTWVIGVFSFEACNFELTAVFEGNKVIQVTDSVPFEFDLEPNQKIYLEYFNWKDTSFTIKITKQMGDAKLYIDSFQYKEDFLSQLPNSTNKIWSLTAKSALNSLLIRSSDPDYCTFCSYLIAVEAETQTRMSILINIEGEFTTLMAGKIVHSYIPLRGNDTYEFYTSINNKKIDINLIVYSGKSEIYVHHNPTVNSSNFLWKYNPKGHESIINFRINHDSSTENLHPIFDGKSYWPSNNGIYYIMVVGLSAVNYTIYVTVPGSSSLLLDGIIGFNSLFPGESTLFNYFSMIETQDKNSTKPIKLGINLYNDQFSTGNSSNTSYPLINITYHSWDNFTEDYIAFAQDMISFPGIQNNVKLSETLRIPAYSGIYYINITNNYTDQPINFSMIINPKDYLLIPPNTIYMSRLGIQEEEVYEIYVNETGVLVIEIFECLGKVIFAATRSFENLQNRIFDLEVRKPSLNGLYGEMKIDSPGTVYLSVKAITGYVISNTKSDIQEALYKIQTNLFTMGKKFPYDYFVPGDEGRITWNISDNNRVHLTWSDSIMDTTGVSESDFKMKDYDVKYDYKLVFTKDELTADSLARCDLMLYSLGGDFSNRSNYSLVIDSVMAQTNNNNTHKKNYDIDLEQGSNYFVSLVCLTQGMINDSVVWQFPIIYETTQMNIPITLLHTDDNKSLLIWIIGGCGVGLIFISAALLYYLRRYKKAVKKLNYEMQDVRNIDEIIDEKVINVGKAKYTGLVEEKHFQEI